MKMGEIDEVTRREISLFPFFLNLDDKVMDGLLKHARIVTYNKGASIFFQYEPVSRLYLVLEGWVKIYKVSEDGNEAVLQMLGVGESLLEVAVVNDTLSPLNAQAADDVRLLSIPVSIVREELKTSHAMAMNLLTALSRRSENLIDQFEQITLKNAMQRVGWFFLRLFLDQKEESKIKLPYDKALIASQLGMKPETFSRALRVLKEQGIEIERNSITLCDTFALCGYCDHALIQRCDRHRCDGCFFQ